MVIDETVPADKGKRRIMDKLKRLIPVSVKHTIKMAIRQYRESYQPRIDKTCAVQFIGTDYGGAPVCVDHLKAGDVVYSFGVGEDISFDRVLIEQYGVELYAFDPTPRSVNWVKSQNIPSAFHFFDYGIAAEDGTLTLYSPIDPSHVSYSVVEKDSTAEAFQAPVKRLKTIMAELGHTQVAIVKLDIEGAEFDVVADIARSKLNIAQLIIEFHHRFPGLDIKQTRQSVDLLRANGYRVAYANQYPYTLCFLKFGGR